MKNIQVRTEYIATVTRISILCVYNIQLTFVWDETEP